MAYDLPTDQYLNASGGMQEVFIYANDVTAGLLFRLILIAIYIIILLSLQRYKDDWGSSFSVAGYITGIMAILFRVAGIIDMWTLTIALVICFVSVIAPFFSRD